jgi:photosystem II stability/assembly factor-like uncharacterized protein
MTRGMAPLPRRSPGLRLFLLVLVALAGFTGANPRVVAAKADNPRLDGWRIIGPGGGGATILPTISPHDPKVVLVACDMTGAYLTEDGGESWRMFNLGTTVSSFAFDPHDPNVIYAGTSALWRSSDRGRSWRMVFPDPTRGTRALSTGDHAEYTLRSDDPLFAAAGERMSIQAIAIASDGAITVAMSGGGVFRGSQKPGALLQSSDKGSHWRKLRDLPPGRILALATAKADDLVVVLEKSVLRLTGTAAKEYDAPPGAPLHDAGVALTGGHATIYALNAATWNGSQLANGLFVSTNDGATWTAASNWLSASLTDPGTGEAPKFRVITVSPQHPSIAYVGLEGMQLGAGRDHRFNGIAKTIDGGRTWRVVHKESNQPSAQMTGSWVEDRATSAGPDVWFDAPYDIGVSPTNPDIVFVTDLFRTYRTLDGGERFVQVHSRPAGPKQWATRGLDVTTAYGVHVDPLDARRMFISYTDIGLFRSEDGGASWMISSEGIPQRWRNTVYWMVFDPSERGLAWAALSGTHDLPRPKMWRTNDPANYRGGIGISHDGGRTWTPAAGGLPVGAVTHLLLDPRGAAGARTLYATMFGHGVYKSTDSGRTWTLKNEGLPDKPFAWRLTQSPGGRLYLVVARRSENGKIGDDGDGALYASDDGADHWTKMALPAGTNAPNALTVDAKDDQRLYLSAWGVTHADGDTGGGIFVSSDAGRSWRAVFDAAQHVYDVTQDTRTGTLYACGFDQGAWRSDDRGEHWQRLRGFNFKWGHRVVPDPATPDRVYITTFGGSVWHGPAQGDPRSPEDIVSVGARTGASDEAAFQDHARPAVHRVR